nr:hypothetical protein [Skermanella aerolata]
MSADEELGSCQGGLDMLPHGYVYADCRRVRRTRNRARCIGDIEIKVGRVFSFQADHHRLALRPVLSDDHWGLPYRHHKAPDPGNGTGLLVLGQLQQPLRFRKRRKHLLIFEAKS